MCCSLLHSPGAALIADTWQNEACRAAGNWKVQMRPQSQSQGQMQRARAKGHTGKSRKIEHQHPCQKQIKCGSRKHECFPASNEFCITSKRVCWEKNSFQIRWGNDGEQALRQPMISHGLDSNYGPCGDDYILGTTHTDIQRHTTYESPWHDTKYGPCGD